MELLTSLFIVVVQLAIFSMYITSIIEVIKGITTLGIWGAIKCLWNNVIRGMKIDSATFPILNFVIAMICCWAFNITIMSYLFSNMMQIQQAGATATQLLFAKWLDYFGTASLTYLGSDKLYKKFIEIKEQATTAKP
jgi:hypothetical protein